MDPEKLNRLLIQRFPEIEKKYHEEVDWQEGDYTGSHVVYEDVFTPYIEKMIEENDLDKLEYIFDFIEELALLKDSYTEEVIMFSVLERLKANNLLTYIKCIKKQTQLLLKLL